MPDPVYLVTIHHEGAGSPTDNAARYADGGYTYGIGATYWTHLRDVWSSYATLNFNHVSLDICLSGDRHTGYPVYDKDIEIIRGAVQDARARGYVVNAPEVRAHRNSPGSSTVCPGDYTIAVWDRIVNACQATAQPPEPGDDDMPQVQCATAVNADGRPELFSLDRNGIITHRWRNQKGGGWSEWHPLGDGPYDSIDAFANTDGRLEVIAHNTDGGYAHCWQTEPNGSWSTWNDL